MVSRGIADSPALGTAWSRIHGSQTSESLSAEHPLSRAELRGGLRGQERAPAGFARAHTQQGLFTGVRGLPLGMLRSTRDR